MSSRQWDKTFVAICIIVPSVVFLAVLVAGRVSAQAVVTLANPGFEDGFRAVRGIGELVVANDWWPWYEEATHSPSGQRYHRPEYKPEEVGVGSGRVLAGTWGQKQFTTYAPHNGGIYQQVSVTPGQWYKFTGNVWIWSSSENNADHSIGPGFYRAMLGCNPWGDTWGPRDTTVWGQEIVDRYDEWVELSVTCQAWGDVLTLFTRGNPVYAVHHNDSYWDLTSLSLVTVGALPTYTPYPTYTAYPTRTPVPCPTSGPRSCPSLKEIATVVYALIKSREPVYYPLE